MNRRLRFIAPPPPYFAVKQVRITVTCTLAALPGFINMIEANLNAIMALMPFNDVALDSAQSFFYNFDTFPVFNIAHGNFYLGPNAGLYEYAGAQLESYIHGSPYDRGAGNPNQYLDVISSTGFVWRATGIGPGITNGFASQAAGIADRDACLKEVNWFWVYFPTLPIGTALPLYREDNPSEDAGIYPNPAANPPTAVLQSKIGNLISVKPDPDTGIAPHVGSVFKIPLLPLTPIGFLVTHCPTGDCWAPTFGGQEFIVFGDVDNTEAGGAGGVGDGGAGGSAGAGGGPGGDNGGL